VSRENLDFFNGTSLPLGPLRFSPKKPIHTSTGFLLAVYRASEVCIGIVSAGIVLAGTDLGGARRRLAALFAARLVECLLIQRARLRTRSSACR
jgi:hypothetical protein